MRWRLSWIFQWNSLWIVDETYRIWSASHLIFFSINNQWSWKKTSRRTSIERKKNLLFSSLSLTRWEMLRCDEWPLFNQSIELTWSRTNVSLVKNDRTCWQRKRKSNKKFFSCRFFFLKTKKFFLRNPKSSTNGRRWSNEFVRICPRTKSAWSCWIKVKNILKLM